MPGLIIGVDLSGPANAADTALAWFEDQGDRLVFVDAVIGAHDEQLVRAAQGLISRGHVIVGIDAPLSYNDGGGDRPSDAALRNRVVRAGMRSGSVMTPTASKMAYLTLRGISVARALESIGVPRASIVEVHPGAALALHGAPLDLVRAFKGDAAPRVGLLQWMQAIGVCGVPDSMASASHSIAACGAALAAWRWRNGAAEWTWKADPPLHPYDFVC